MQADEAQAAHQPLVEAVHAALARVTWEKACRAAPCRFNLRAWMADLDQRDLAERRWCGRCGELPHHTIEVRGASVLCRPYGMPGGDNGAACSSSLEHDSATAQCAGWCRVEEAYHHCAWCKCQRCGYCAPVSSRTHVYATGSNGMVACEANASALKRGIEDDDVSLSHCREICDASFEGDGACHSITYSVDQQRCVLNSAAGKPRFCFRDGWATHWRIDVDASELLLLPQAAGDGFAAAAANGLPPSSSVLLETATMAPTEVDDEAPPRRLQADGAELIDTETGASVALHGVNMFVDYLEFDDIALMRSLLPTANVVRLVGVLWGDAPPPLETQPPEPGNASATTSIVPAAVTTSAAAAEPESVCAPTDRCCVDDPTVGYFAEQCLAALLVAVERLSAAGLWVIVAAKGRYAAGDGWPEVPDVFHSMSLTTRMCAMWRHIAAALRPLPMVAGYEVLSEPRNKHVAQQTVRRFYEAACSAVHSSDPRVLCVVGPTPYYKVWMLNETLLLRMPEDGGHTPRGAGQGRQTSASHNGPTLMRNIMYTFDFYDPWEYITQEHESSLMYPATYKCAHAYPGWVALLCPHGAEQQVRARVRVGGGV